MVPIPHTGSNKRLWISRPHRCNLFDKIFLFRHARCHICPLRDTKQRARLSANSLNAARLLETGPIRNLNRIGTKNGFPENDRIALLKPTKILSPWPHSALSFTDWRELDDEIG